MLLPAAAVRLLLLLALCICVSGTVVDVFRSNAFARFPPALACRCFSAEFVRGREGEVGAGVVAMGTAAGAGSAGRFHALRDNSSCTCAC